MKRNRITAIFAFAATGLLACACSKGSDHRREPGNGDNNNIIGKYLENPSWTITYTGRSIDVGEDGTYIVDIISVKSSDEKDYYLDVIGRTEFESRYRGNIQAYLEDIEINPDWVYSGDSENVFDMLDTRPGEWIAVAVESISGEKGWHYSKLEFRTSEVEYRKDNSWKLSYTPRVTIKENGKEVIVDEIRVTPNGCDYSYYVELAYPEYLAENYDGSEVAFFNDVLDGIADTLPEDEDFAGVVYNGDVSIQFDRLRSGDWTAYAFGVDRRGYLTGNWSELHFDAPQEEATEEFNRWLGTWRIGGQGGGYNYDTDRPVSGYYYYDITVSSSENNYCYIVNDWETGVSAGDFANTYCPDYQYETSFLKETGQMQFKTTYLGTLEDDEIGVFDVMLLGMVSIGSEDYYILDEEIPIATATLSEDGQEAQVAPEKAEVAPDGGKSTVCTFKSMQYIDVTDHNLYTYNDGVPYLPMTMERLSSSASSVSRRAARPLPAERRVSGSGAAGMKALSPGNCARRHVSSGVSSRKPSGKAVRQAKKASAVQAAGRTVKGRRK